MKRALIAAVAATVLLAVGVWYFATQGAGRPVSVTAGDDRHIVTVHLDTPRSGDRTVTLQITDRAGALYTAPYVPVTAVLPTVGYSSPLLSARPVSPGHFQVSDVPLMAPGDWEIHLTLLDPHGEEHLEVPVSVTY